MFRSKQFKQFALAGLFTFAAAMPTAAAPPGYERLVAPTGESEILWEQQIPNSLCQNLNSDNWGTQGYRPVDVEINWHHPDIVDWEKVGPYKALHTISVVEVPNDPFGPLAEWGWSMDLEATDLLFSFYLESQTARPIDIELYFRKEPAIDGGQVEAHKYACIWVPNKGSNRSAWDYIPLMPAGALENELAVRYTQGWRPYDVEFAVNDVGQAFGTALLAPIVSFDPLEGTQIMWTQWDWYTESELQAEVTMGWQLLDFEYPPNVQEPLISNPSQWYGEPVKFCILVFPQNLPQFPDTHTEIIAKYLTAYKFHDVWVDHWGDARLIDLETGFFEKSCGKNGLCEGGYDTYSGAWLFPF